MRGPSLAAAAAIDGDRLQDRLARFACIGAIPGNGVNRAAFSAEDIRARELLVGYAVARGWDIACDPIGNLFLRRDGLEPQAPAVLTGSHMDSQPRGGRFDGIYGVLAGVEVLEALDAAGIRTRRPIEVVAWSNEEGGRFAPCTMGSMVHAGARSLDEVLDIRDAQGVRLADALSDTLAATRAAAPAVIHRPFGLAPAAYVEAHIEQGPVLETAGCPIGVVTGIQGMQWFEIEVEGESAHAGTAPLSTRRDALREALSMIAALQQLAADPQDVTRFTVGRLRVSPDSPNSVPGHVLFTVDLRHPDADTLARLGDAVEPTCRAQARHCAVRVRRTLADAPVRFAAHVADTVERSARALGLPSLRLPSGATHDALYMASLCPTGMVFVPCERGISHNEAEHADPADLTAGARVLAATLVELAER